MAKKFLVFIEQRSGKIKKASLEAASKTAELAKELNADVEAITVGNEIENLSILGSYGICKLTHYKNGDLTDYSSSAYTEIVAKHANDNGFTDVVLSNTALGKDLAPRIAVKIDAGITVDCTTVEIDGDDLKFTRPVYAGKAFVEVKITNEKKVFTLRPNVFPAKDDNECEVEVKEQEVDNPNLDCRVVELKKSEGKLDVAEADIIVSGGRGMKGPENFNLIEDLASVLGAATGASRAVVDAGWRPHSEQVGQTGKTVSPSLYVAVGISGAIQHLAGMRSSKYIVAINKDKDAPIFQVADYGIAGDAFEVVPALIEELKKIQSN